MYGSEWGRAQREEAIMSGRNGLRVSLVGAVFALLHGATEVHAQCRVGPQKSGMTQQNGSMLSPQMQLLMQQQRLLTGLGYAQQQQQMALLTALQQQRQQNSSLIAVGSNQVNGLMTAVQNQRYLAALQTATLQTQQLLAALQQQYGFTDPSGWQNALQQQYSSLLTLSQP
jgi:hypothetical protein